jgi:hypothetical protein
MKARKLISLMSGMLLLASFTASFAMMTTCPSVGEVRQRGSNLSYAYNIKDDRWVLASDPFNDDQGNWQTIYSVNLGFETSDPSAVVGVAQVMFDKSPIPTEPMSTSTATGRTECLYTTVDQKYQIMVVTPVRFGFNKG